jgi:trimethylamine--corrinoid protein Co-methyltransferase
MIEMGMTFDFGQLVLDNEVAQMVKHTVKGIPVNDETLAVDVIKEIGIGKDFLSHDSTYRHMRSLSAPLIFDRKMREDWEQAGRTDIYAKATEKAREILETHIPEPLPDNVRKKIHMIVEKAEAELGISK